MQVNCLNNARNAAITVESVEGVMRVSPVYGVRRTEVVHMQQGPDGKRTWHNILEAAGKTRPTMLETVYGLDVIIPGKHAALPATASVIFRMPYSAACY